MSIDVTVFSPSTALVEPLLALCPGAYVVELEAVGEYAIGGLAGVALAEDYYGKVTALASDLDELLSAHAAESVLWFDDLVVPPGSARVWEYMLGQWRPDFLRYLKAAARAGIVEIRVQYTHERGDYPYETAHWTFDYRVPQASFESLAVTDYGGGTARWIATTERFAGGEVRATYQQDG